jgi:DNA adenine methylase
MLSMGNVERPILRYHGGKWLLADWIIQHMPQHSIYVEPFGGAGSVLMQKPRSYAEVYNDKWDTVVNVFRVVRDPKKAKELRRRLELTPYARAEFDRTGEIDVSKIRSSIERARLTILRSFAGFGSASTNANYSTGFRGTSHRSGTTPAMDWNNLPTHVDSWIERLKSVTIESLPAIEVILRNDSKETLNYLDPPYVHSTRNMRRGNASYVCEMTDDDHRLLAAVLRGVKGMVMLSGYDCPLYGELYEGWERIERKHMADGARARTEVLWFNPAAWRNRPQMRLLETA